MKKHAKNVVEICRCYPTGIEGVVRWEFGHIGECPLIAERFDREFPVMPSKWGPLVDAILSNSTPMTKWERKVAAESLRSEFH